MVFGSVLQLSGQDFRSRLLRVNRDGLAYLPATLLLFPASLLAAAAISLLFGKSPSQFRLIEKLSLMILVLAPTFEEIGWRGYAVDSLKGKSSLLKASLQFSLLWALWHVPLFFTNGYYQNELRQMGIPCSKLLRQSRALHNHLELVYYRTNRSILTAVLFHIVAVVCPEAFLVDESTKFIQTAILLVAAVVIVLKNRALFTAQGL